MPSIQTSLLTPMPAWLGQMLPGLRSAGVRPYMASSAPENPVSAAPARAGNDRHDQCRSDRDLARGQQAQEPGGRDVLQHGEGACRHPVHGFGARLVAMPLLQAGVEYVAACGDAARKVTCRHGQMHRASFLVAVAGRRGSESGEDLPQVVEIDPGGVDVRRVGGVQAPVDEADERLGRQSQRGQLAGGIGRARGIG